MHSDYHLIVRERGEQRGKWGERGGSTQAPRGGKAVCETFSLSVPEVSATGRVNKTDPDKIQPAGLFAPPHTFYLLNSNHYAMIPLLLKNVNSHK